MSDSLSPVENTDAAWRGLYKAGAAAALIAVVFFRRYIAAELVAFKGFGVIAVPEPLPSQAAGWFALLQHNRLLGLVLLGAIDLINYALVGLIFLALYGALRGMHKSAMLIATTFAFVGIAVYFASNQAFALLSLSDKYAAANTEAEKAALAAAGEALLAVHNPNGMYQGTGIYLSLFLVLISGLIISIVMLSSSIFGKATAVVGILANGLGLGSFLALAAAPAIYAVFPASSAPFRIAWYLLIAWKLFQLGRDPQKKQSQ